MSKVTPFKPYLKGPKTTPPGLRDRIVNYTRVTERQQQLLILAASEILRRGEDLTLDAIRAAAPALELPDVMPGKLVDAANAVRQRPNNPLPALADALDLLGGVPAEVIARRRAERRHAATTRMLQPLGYHDIAERTAGQLLPCWRRRLEDGTDILISPDRADADPADAAWVAVLFDRDSNRLGDSGSLQPLRRLLDRIAFIRRETQQ
jgi:hypothetical protein